MTELEYEKARRAPPGAAAAWGIMYLDGGLNDRPVTLGNETGRSFTGLNGDGKLDIVVSAGRNNKVLWYEREL